MLHNLLAVGNENYSRADIRKVGKDVRGNEYRDSRSAQCFNWSRNAIRASGSSPLAGSSSKQDLRFVNQRLRKLQPLLPSKRKVLERIHRRDPVKPAVSKARSTARPPAARFT